METAEEVHVKKRRNHQIVEFALLPDTPTVFPNADYDANGRADDLYKALKGIGKYSVFFLHWIIF